MSYKCDYCDKGQEHGHMVSHAKNRLGRLFKPNLQKLKVMLNGSQVRVKFCASCIKRLKKDGHMGLFSVIKYTTSAKDSEKTIKAALKSVEKVSKAKKEKEVKEKVKAKEKAAETLDIAAIVGKKV